MNEQTKQDLSGWLAIEKEKAVANQDFDRAMLMREVQDVVGDVSGAAVPPEPTVRSVALEDWATLRKALEDHRAGECPVDTCNDGESGGFCGQMTEAFQDFEKTLSAPFFAAGITLTKEVELAASVIGDWSDIDKKDESERSIAAWSLAESLRKAASTYRRRIAASPPEGEKPIEEVFQEIASEIPKEELDKLPADLSSRVDEIVYGQPPHAAPEEERAMPEYDAKDKAEKLMARVGPSIVLGDAVAEAERELSYAYRLGKDDGERIKEGAALLVRCHFEVAEEALGEDEARRRFHERFDRYLEEVRALANEKEGGSHGTPVADPAGRREAPRSSAGPADTSTSRG